MPRGRRQIDEVPANKPAAADAEKEPKKRDRKPKQLALMETAPEGCEALVELAQEYVATASERGSISANLKDLKVTIANEMKAKSMTVFKHEGVTITLTESDPKLRVQVDGEGDEEEEDDSGVEVN